MKIRPKRILCLLLALAMLLGLLPAVAFAASTPTTLYLTPNDNWKVDNARFAAYFFGNGETWVSMTDSNGDGIYEAAVPAGFTSVIFCRMNPSATANSWDNRWNQTADLTIPTDGNNCYTVAEGAWDEGSWSTYTPPADITCQVTLHFADSLGWSNIYLYTWIGSNNQLGGWPGTQAGLDEDGFYTVTFQAQIPGGQSLNFIFNNGGNGCQTVDLSIPYSDLESGSVEKWVQPTTEYQDEDTSNAKFNCDIMDSADAAVQSPVVNGTSVTFEYKDPSASSVKVAGSWNSWTQLSMTKNTYGVWSITVTDLTPGIYQYKFVADGSWVSDPVNPWIMTEDQNSAFIVLDPNAEDKNEVTVKLHYSRSDGNYSGWNAWIWTLNAGAGQYDLTNEDGHMTATITVPGRSTRYVSYIMRYSTDQNKWEQQEYGERRVDLSDIVSGTVHCYVNSGEYTAVRVLDTDVVQGNKISSVDFDYVAGNKITVTTTRALSNPQTELSISGDSSIESITTLGSTYTLTLNKSLELAQLYQYKILFDGYEYDIGYTSAYATDRFAAEYTYEGGDLGATWTENETTFRVWAPTANDVAVHLYATGSDSEEGAAHLGTYPMTADVNGTWVVTIQGDLQKVYYTYAVNVDGKTVEACDPYARTTGVNGKRGMVMDLDSTDPEGWSEDSNPNPSTSYTDAVIYELHVRDFSIDDSSGIMEDYQGKFLAFTQEGSTVNGEGSIATGIDYLKELGITHLHLLPVYDYGSVDETTCDSFNWGYDPVNYNTPEGSYSTDPYKGEVRVEEFKQMVMALHEAGISVVMDVVYNHVYDADQFCLNQIVPGYFSRQNADGSYSNSSGCGNDTASEREMVRKYIVDSVKYWTEEYHIDGFRFDLVGLIDVDTINQLIAEVHENRPDVIFYGEGWTLGGAVEPGTVMATQANAVYTPEMAYFNDRIRDAMGGYNGTATGFVSGATDKAEALAGNFRAITDYTSDPQQLIQYISCHDNHTLMAKLLLSTGKSAIDSQAVRMNNLAAAIYLTAQGIPFIHAGEEMLRLKVNPDGSYNENSYNSSDAVNAIDWNKLQTEMYADTSDYYKGLIAFRKTHPALRYATTEEIAQNVTAMSISDSLVCFKINGTAANDLAETIYVIFNAGQSTATVSLPAGTWNVCIDGENAGADTLYTASGNLSVAGISAMVLVQNEAQAAAEVNGVKYATVQAAADAAAGKTVKLLQSSTETVNVTGDLYLDLNGKSLSTLNISLGTLYGMDSTTDDYDCADGYGKIGTVNGSTAITHSTNSKSYLTVSDEGVSFHRYYVGLTHVTLNPASTGVGYKAVFAGDAVVQSQLDTQDTYGYSLWLTEDRVVTRSAGIDKFQSGKTVTLLLKNFDVENYGSAPVYAQVYLKLADGTVIRSHTCGYSLQQLVEAVSANLNSYTSAQLEAVQQLCKDHSEATASWKIQALLNRTA